MRRRPRLPLVLALCLVAVLGTSGRTVAATLHVGTGEPGAFATPQEAIDAAEYGDEIVLAAGRYSGRLDFTGRAVGFRGAGIGKTQIEPGCGGTDFSGVVFGNGGPALAIEDMTFFAECPGPWGSGLGLRLDSRATPTFRRVAVVFRGELHFGPDPLPNFVTASGLIEDLYVEQLPTPCPATVRVGLKLNLAPDVPVRRLFFADQCGLSLMMAGQVDIPATYSNILVTTRGREPLFVGSYGPVSHLTAAYSAPFQPGLVNGVRVSETIPPPSLSSSVITGTTASPVQIICTEQEGDWDFHWNDFWGSDPGFPVLHERDSIGIDWGPCPGPIPMEEAGNISLDPMFIHWTRDDNMSDDNFCPAPGSPLIDAGDPDELDPDGTRADIGAFGGPYAFSCEEVLDNDGDGYRPITGDCDDTNADRWPFHEEVPCDGVDQDCDGSDIVDCGDDDSADDDSADDDSADDDSADDDSAVSSSDDDSAVPPESEPWSFLSSCISACEGEGGAALLLPIVLLVRRRFRVRSE